jgi:hypothetical protein
MRKRRSMKNEKKGTTAEVNLINKKAKTTLKKAELRPFI